MWQMKTAADGCSGWPTGRIRVHSRVKKLNSAKRKPASASAAQRDTAAAAAASAAVDVRAMKTC